MTSGIEYCSKDTFDFSYDSIKDVIVKEASGWMVDMSPSDSENSIGCGPKGKSLVLSTPAQPKYGELTVVLIPGEHQQGSDEKLREIYDKAASKANLGEASNARELRNKEATVNVYYSGTDGKIAITYTFKGVIPSSFDVPARSAESSNLETWTFKFQYERMEWKEG